MLRRDFYRRFRIPRHPNVMLVIQWHVGGRPDNRLLGWVLYVKTEPR